MLQNCHVRVSRFSLRYVSYLYFDVRPYLADALFARRRLRVRFLKEYGRDGFPYRAILCSVRRRDEDALLEALDELERKMLLCGYPTYSEDVRSFMQEVGIYETDAAAKAE